MADVFSALENWLVTTGATQSMVRLSWAVLTILWLGHVAATTRPGREPDFVGTFGRLLVAGGLLTAVGSLNRVIVLMFDTFRDAGSAVLSGLIGQHWSQFLRDWLTPQNAGIFDVFGPWFAYPWALAVLLIGILLGVLLFAFGYMVYLAILFFAHLTLLLALFLAPLSVALLAAPSTTRWTARWAVVIVKTGLVVFTVRLIHAAALYLAVIVPVRQVSASLRSGLPEGNLAALGILLLNLAWFLVLMIVGTGIGVYAMLRAERLTGQFVEGVALGEGVLAGPMWLRGRLADWYSRQTQDRPPPSVATFENAWGDRGPWGSPAGTVGGAQEATVIKSGRRTQR